MAGLAELVFPTPSVPKPRVHRQGRSSTSRLLTEG